MNIESEQVRGKERERLMPGPKLLIDSLVNKSSVIRSTSGVDFSFSDNFPFRNMMKISFWFSIYAQMCDNAEISKENDSVQTQKVEQ